MKKETHTVNLANVLDNSRTDQDPIIQANDVILVPSQGRSGSIFISGEVNRPGTIQLPGERKFMAREDILPQAASRTLPTSAKSAPSAPPLSTSKKSRSISRPSSMRGAWTAMFKSRRTTSLRRRDLRYPARPGRG